jgi:hypothetical protein
MKNPRYHIFLSYRREDGKELARLIKESLTAKGYRVFLDMDELQDGVFDERILSAIEEAPIYMILMTEHCFDRCCNTNDWVRQEMEHAIRKKKIIVPLNPDKQFSHHSLSLIGSFTILGSRFRFKPRMLITYSAFSSSIVFLPLSRSDKKLMLRPENSERSRWV